MRAVVLLVVLSLAHGARELLDSSWRDSTDGVMGGRSETFRADFAHGVLSWSGSLSVQGGGFTRVGRSWPVSEGIEMSGGILVGFEGQSGKDGLALPLGLHLSGQVVSGRYSHAAAFAVPPGSAPGEVRYALLRPSAFTHHSSRGWTCQHSCGSITSGAVVSLSLYVLYQEGDYAVNITRVAALSEAEAEAFEFPSPAPLEWMHTTDVDDYLSRTIGRGGFVFDKGYPALCTSIYAAAAEAVARAAIDPKLRGLLCQGLQEATKTGNAVEPSSRGTYQAWILRRTFDAVLAVARNATELPEQERYPLYAKGNWLSLEKASVSSAQACGLGLPPPVGDERDAEHTLASQVREGAYDDTSFTSESAASPLAFAATLALAAAAAQL
mmetsp:Transcript_16812/g.54991  ORF Transcript_16812/g.54991 Transcript_16812/m.54991 type:complete len:383 (-) Transcript_16812:1086-2234(-)